MMYETHFDWREAREFLGTLAHRGWRPYLGWGISSGLIAIVFAIAYRLFQGTLGLAEMAALAAAIVPMMQYIQLRGPSAPSGGGLVNNTAL